ncbi:hypothetical protein ACFU53_37300 [Streptomyces sp. NPDC057474]|uniref:hypothetical protein n=1 Tax=Streptomyces sp. NPDC057474 TaxID=3346144 RepID=UPI0036A92021
MEGLSALVQVHGIPHRAYGALCGDGSRAARQAAARQASLRRLDGGRQAAARGVVSGGLTFHSGTGTGRFGDEYTGTDWPTTITAISFGDLSGDRCNDVLVRYSSGALRLFKPGCGAATTPSTSYTTLATLRSPADCLAAQRVTAVARARRLTRAGRSLRCRRSGRGCAWNAWSCLPGAWAPGPGLRPAGPAVTASRSPSPFEADYLTIEHAEIYTDGSRHWAAAWLWFLS